MDTTRFAAILLHTTYEAGVDFADVCTVRDAYTRITRDCPELLASVLLGDDAYSPTIGCRLADLDDDEVLYR